MEEKSLEDGSYFYLIFENICHGKKKLLTNDDNLCDSCVCKSKFPSAPRICFDWNCLSWKHGVECSDKFCDFQR